MRPIRSAAVAVLLLAIVMALLLVPVLGPITAVADSPTLSTAIHRTDALLLPVRQAGTVAVRNFENVMASIPLGIAFAVAGLSLLLAGLHVARRQQLHIGGGAGAFHRLAPMFRPA